MVTKQSERRAEVIFDPAVRRFVPTPGSSTRQPTLTGQTLGPSVLIVWLPLTAVVGWLVWIGYVFHAADKGASICGGGGTLFGPSWAGGGQASNGSIITAAIVGVLLWLASGAAVWRVVRKTERFSVGLLVLGLFGVGSIVLYLAVLAALWYVSPLIWGSRYC